MFIVTKLFNTVVNEFDALKSARYSRAWLVTELDVRGTQCSSFRDDTEPPTSTKRSASVAILAGQNEAGLIILISQMPLGHPGLSKIILHVSSFTLLFSATVIKP